MELFGNPINNELNWPTAKMRNVAPAVPYVGVIEPEGDKYWLLNLEMVESNTGRILEKTMVSSDDIGPSTTTFCPRNVLFSKLRPYLNKVVIPDGFGYTTTEMIPLMPDISRLIPEFFERYLRGDEFLYYIEKQVSGTKMPRVQMNVFWDIDVILPPLSVQRQFVDFAHQTDKSKFACQIAANLNLSSGLGIQ